MTRQEYMDWCKQRALEYVNAGDTENAFASMMSDLSEHEETENHAGIQHGMMLSLAGKLNTADEMRKFIEGFR